MKQKNQKSIKQLVAKTLIFLSLFVIAFILLQTLLLFYFNFSINNRSFYLSQLYYINHQLDSYLQCMKSVARSVSADALIQEYSVAYSESPDAFLLAQQVEMMERLLQYKNNNDILYSIHVYSADHTWISGSAPHFSDQPEYMELPTAPRWIANTQNKDHTKSTYSLTLLQPFYSISNAHLLGYVELNLSTEALNQLLICNQDYQKLIVVDNEQAIQGSNSDIALGSLCPFPLSTQNIHTIIYSSDYKCYYLAEQNETLNWYIVSLTPFTAYLKPLVLLFIVIIAMATICFLLCRPMSSVFSERLTIPIYRLIEHTAKIKEGNWVPMPLPHEELTDIYELYRAFNDMLLAQEQLKNQLIYEQHAKDKLSFNLLQEQINPHFLYNTLDNICSLAELENTSLLVEIVMNLSLFYKNTLNSGKTFITLHDEIEICESYLRIMQIRYFNKFDYSIQCPNELKMCYCIKLLLQPVIENSICHGISEISGHGFIEIVISSQEEDLVITIRDNGIGLKDGIVPPSSPGFGLDNIRHRIALYYGEPYGITLNNHPAGGCITTIQIPKQFDLLQN